MSSQGATESSANASFNTAVAHQAGSSIVPQELDDLNDAVAPLCTACAHGQVCPITRIISPHLPCILNSFEFRGFFLSRMV